VGAGRRARVVSGEQLEARRLELGASPDLAALLAAIEQRNATVLARAPIIPDVKALLSKDGGTCPDDGAPLDYDPWNPERHTCPRCGKSFHGVRHHRHWARSQHLWVAERAVELATIGALRSNEAAASRAREILQAYGARYFTYPNRDNVLGPARLFFSTYLESLWITNVIGAATVLRAAGALDDATERAVSQIADEAANLIGEFDERYSNRQTWNNAALVAIATWFGDEELARGAVSGQNGLAAHLMYGFRRDGLWYEGENYHLFALRGLITGMTWARTFGIDFMADRRLADRVLAALVAPARTALPDFTFPARKDSRFGVSLAQPTYLETWEVALALGGLEQWEAEDAEMLVTWLRALYGIPTAELVFYDWYLHDAPTAPRPHTPRRSGLSWWGLLNMLPQLPETAAAWSPGNTLLEDQGLAVLRAGDRYVSLEAGPWGGGHGHPDRLNLTLHAGGTYWLPDPGTGTYVADDLAWYRSTIAHNAPRLGGASQSPARAVCEMFGESDDWAWTRGRFGDVTRTVVAGPHYVIDVIELAGREDRLLEVPWHWAGETDVQGRGTWLPAEWPEPFVTGVERLDQPAGKAVVISARDESQSLSAHLVFDGELLRATGPGLPNDGRRHSFYVMRGTARNARWVTVMEPGGELVQEVTASGDVIDVRTRDGVHRHRLMNEGWLIELPSGRLTLSGPQEEPEDFEPLLSLEPPERAHGVAWRLDGSPALDGSHAGFDMSEPLTLDIEDQYRRSEEAYPGPDDFSATAVTGWDEAALYVAVDVTKPELHFRPPDAPPLLLDNEPDDIHSDGLQVYLGDEEGRSIAGVLVVPEPDGALRVSVAGGTTTQPDAVRGGWQATEHGYRVTLAFPWPEWLRPHHGARIGFDLIINEMLAGRERRAGQLAWTGGNGWVYLRGDRAQKDRLGELELVG
jgi:hypothetical protein